MKKLLQTTAYLLVLVSILSLKGNNVQMSNNCYSENVGWCSESLDWDYTTDDEQITNEIKCDNYTKLFCTDKISAEAYKDLVSNIGG